MLNPDRAGSYSSEHSVPDYCWMLVCIFVRSKGANLWGLSRLVIFYDMLHSAEILKRITYHPSELWYNIIYYVGWFAILSYW